VLDSYRNRLNAVPKTDYHEESKITCAARLLASLLPAAACPVQASEKPADVSRKPNIVIILADDQGYEDSGFMGSKEIVTPNLDKLAHEGMILKSFYVQPVCSPSRAALMSGRYARQNA